MAVVDDPRQGAHDICLETEIHGQVGIEPVSQYAHTDEFGTLAVYLFLGIIPAPGAKLVSTDFHPRLADFFLYIQLDRQAMAIPARHIRRIKAGQAAGLDNHVLQNFVDGVTQVQLTVRIGRAVVKDKFRSSGAGCPDLLVKAHLLPLFQALRFPLGQAGLHREGRPGQVQRVFVVAHNVICTSAPVKPGPRVIDIPRNVLSQFFH